MRLSGSTMQKRMLARMLPVGLSGQPVRWQQQKSAQTRLRMVMAAMDCLVTDGYGGLTTQQVAERTGISRGAMHHHFPTRFELVTAVIDHVFYERMRLFLDDYLAELARSTEGELVEIATAAHWRSVQTPEYAAYLELAVAARTDPELQQFFEPAARRYDEVWITEMIESFPQWEAQWEAMKLANDLAMVAHMGLLLNRPVMGEDRINRVNELISQVLRGLYQS